LSNQDYLCCCDCELIVLRPLLSERALEDRYANAALAAGVKFDVALDAARREISSLEESGKNARPRFMRLASEIYDRALVDMVPGKILDIGCGIGAELLRLYHKGWEIYGEDYNRIAIVALNERFPGHFRLSGARDRGWDETFDVIMLNQVLEHLTSPQELLRNLRRLLKQGGRLVIVTPNAASWARTLFGPYWIQYWPPEHVALYGPAQISRLLLQSGWRPHNIATYAAPGTDYALSVRQLLGLPPEPSAVEKLPWFPLSWIGSLVGCSSELVAVAVPAPL
jgi:2-polyprenyl-3-methyl-5-hydroxy-6-metoxy-1,4-benzoquinol methylase